MAKIYGVQFDNTVVDLRDLPARSVQRTADAHRIDWWVVLTAPFADLDVAAEVLREATRYLGVDEPPLASVREVIAATEAHFVPIAEGELRGA